MIEKVRLLHTMEAATSFLHACEKGEGWKGCSPFCGATTSFTVQATDACTPDYMPAISKCTTLEDYTELMKGLVESMGEKATYTIHASAFDSTTSNAIFFMTFGGITHYVYVLHVEDDKVTSLTKIWNDSYAAKILSGA